MTSIFTPSTGASRPHHINMNRLGIKPKDRVIYRSARLGGFAVDTVDAYSDMSGNFFTIDGEVIFVSNILGRVRPGADEAAMIHDFDRYDREGLTSERLRLLRKIHRIAG